MSQLCCDVALPANAFADVKLAKFIPSVLYSSMDAHCAAETIMQLH